jgi:hypothetical protein
MQNPLITVDLHAKNETIYTYTKLFAYNDRYYDLPIDLYPWDTLYTSGWFLFLYRTESFPVPQHISNFKSDLQEAQIIQVLLLELIYN